MFEEDGGAAVKARELDKAATNRTPDPLTPAPLESLHDNGSPYTSIQQSLKKLILENPTLAQQLMDKHIQDLAVSPTGVDGL